MKKWKYHILMLLRMQIGGVRMPRQNSNGITDYALKIVEVMRNEELCKTNCIKALQTIEKELERFKEFSERNPPPRLRAFTQQIIDTASTPESQQDSAESGPILDSRESGKLLWYDGLKNFGFIERDAGGDIFVHRSGITDIPWNLREPGTRVIYAVAQDPKDASLFKADNVRLEG